MTGVDGELLAHTSPLDVHISFPAAERTISQTLDLIVESIQRSSGVQIGRAPAFDGGPGYFETERVTVGAQNEEARRVLSRTTMVPGQPKFSWTLTHMPDVRSYTLSLNPVLMEATQTPEGRQMGIQIYWPKP